MFDLTSRELASVILITAVVVVFMLVPNLRHQMAPHIAGLVKAFFVWKLLRPIFVYFVYAFGVVYLAWYLGLWSLGQVRDTAIVVFFVGLPMVFGASKVTEGTKLIRDMLRDVAGVSALLVFYVGFGVFPLWGELLLQPIVTFLVMCSAVAHRNPEHRAVERLVNGLLGFISVGMFIYTTATTISTWGSDDVSDALNSLALSIWLPLALIPFVYVFAFIMRCETILVLLPYSNNRKKPERRVRVACIGGLRFSTRLASEFTPRWRGELAQSSGLREARRVMERFRQAVKERDDQLKSYNERLQAMAGASGADRNGLQLDRREFDATKKTLNHIYFMQMGWHRNRGGHYRPELLDFLGDVTRRGLPAEHGIKLIVRKDKQAWRAWRQTPGGWYFGVGGTLTLEHQWQYDGPTPPNGFPSNNSRWIDATRNPPSPEWAKNDEPPTSVRSRAY